ncbi:hypothetical protein [Roseibium sp.]|uniref:hypothetical protein n=1 Tax=Roseibium sp. TaxID=1936156 RepID=UPI003BAC1F55
MRKFLAMAAVGSLAMTGAQADVSEEDLANDATNTSGGLTAGSDPLVAPDGRAAGHRRINRP